MLCCACVGLLVKADQNDWNMPKSVEQRSTRNAASLGGKATAAFPSQTAVVVIVVVILVVVVAVRTGTLLYAGTAPLFPYVSRIDWRKKKKWLGESIIREPFFGVAASGGIHCGHPLLRSGGGDIEDQIVNQSDFKHEISSKASLVTKYARQCCLNAAWGGLVRRLKRFKRSLKAARSIEGVRAQGRRLIHLYSAWSDPA